jgi:hypothetical protein
MDIDHESLYQTELIYLRNGRPVWEPNPDTLYDCVRIGDVGYFQNGKFVPIFNILPPDDSNPNRRLPFPQPDFPPLRLIGNPTHRTNPLAGIYALESRLTFSISGGIERLAFRGILESGKSSPLLSQRWIGTPRRNFSVIYRREGSGAHFTIPGSTRRRRQQLAIQKAHAR